MNIIGIDVGITGGIAAILGGEEFVYEMPTQKIVMSTGRTVTKIDAIKLAQLLKSIIDSDSIVAIESVSARPGQGVSSMFGFGRSLGVIEGVCAALNISPLLIRPQEWKSAFPTLVSSERKAAKIEARKLATEKYKSLKLEFIRAKDDGKAEALLLATYVLNKQKKEEAGE